MPLQGAILDCTCSELFTGKRELSSKVHAPGVIPLTDGLHVAVSKEWLQIHSQTFEVPGAEKDKVFFYPESWEWP